MLDNLLYQKLSRSIETLRFPLILLIVFLHCYTSTSAVTRGHDTYFRLLYPFSLWMGEAGVPSFFFISGLLLFYSKKTYVQKIKSRFQTLLVPYLFFNALILCGYLCLMYLGKTVMIADKDLANYTLMDYIRAFWDRGEWDFGNGSPVLCPFWYIRNLMILAILSPIMFYIIKYTKILFPVIFGLLWINAYDSAYTLQSLTMFSLGAYFPICDRNPIEISERYKVFFVGAFMFLAAMDLLHLYMSIPFALPFHRLSLVANTFFFICFLGEFLYRHHIYSTFLSKSAFFIFCIHYPIIISLRVILLKINVYSDYVLIAAYFFSVLFVMSISLLLYGLLIRLFPRIISYITGGRA